MYLGDARLLFAFVYLYVCGFIESRLVCAWFSIFYWFVVFFVCLDKNCLGLGSSVGVQWPFDTATTHISDGKSGDRRRYAQSCVTFFGCCWKSGKTKVLWYTVRTHLELSDRAMKCFNQKKNVLANYLDRLPMVSHSIVFRINRTADTWERHFPVIWSIRDQVSFILNLYTI